MSGQVAVDRRVHEPDQAVASGRDQTERPVEALLPLVLDIDTADLPEALGWEAALCAARARPAAIPVLAARAMRGRAALESAACAIDGIDLASLPLGPVLPSALRQAADEGRRVLLLTAMHPALARKLREAHPCVSEVIVAAGGDPIADLARTAAVRARCPAGFAALADGGQAPWARTASPYRLDPAATAPDRTGARPATIRVWARALRLHQWAKNALVFVPLILAGHAFDPMAWLLAATAFLAFGLAASSTYLLNDLHDLAHDRAHRSKRNRPLASGILPIPHALAAAALGLSGCALLAAIGGPAGIATIGAYIGLTLAYTFAIKRHMVVDTVALAGLFTLRLVGGIAFCAVAGSAWLLAFSMFVFTSLALGKRFVEIDAGARSGLARIAGRGYVAEDGPAVLALGAATSAAAVLILSLFIVEASAGNAFYVHAELLWAAPVALFIWLGRIWILCGRGALRDDPVEFALTDRASHGLGLVIAASFALACLNF